MHIDLGNVGDLAKPITKLIDVIAKGTGLAPLGTILQAKADAKAKVIETKANIAANSLTERAQMRVEYREKIRQQNIEIISKLATKELPNSVSSEPVEQDWILQYFDYAQDVCDEEIQSLWARILAGEVASPGSYTKRTLQFLKTIEKEDANKFSELCAFAFTDKNGWHYVGRDEQTSKEIREKLGDGDYVGHFKSIGLLLPEEYMFKASALTDMQFNYFNKNYVFKGPPKPQATNSLASIERFFPMLPFSQIGQQLAKIARPSLIEGYVDRLSESLKKELNAFLCEESASGAVKDVEPA